MKIIETTNWKEWAIMFTVIGLLGIICYRSGKKAQASPEPQNPSHSVTSESK